MASSLITSSTCDTSAGSAFSLISFAHYKLGHGKKLTASAGRRVDAREKTLSGGNGALETLDNLGEVITNGGLFIELLLEVGEDGRIEQRSVGGHNGGLREGE